MAWIKCSDRLPEYECHVVIVLMSDSTMNMGWYENGKWEGEIPGSVDQTVSHWMPLFDFPEDFVGEE